MQEEHRAVETSSILMGSPPPAPKSREVALLHVFPLPLLLEPLIPSFTKPILGEPWIHGHGL